MEKRRESDQYEHHGEVDHAPVHTEAMGHDHGGVDYERRDVDAMAILVSTIIGVVIIVVTLIGVAEYFLSEREKVYAESVLKPEPTSLREQRARDTETLNSYKVLDAKKGVYQIPIDVAMQKMADRAYQKTLNKPASKK